MHGGKRIGAGRKPIHGESTKVIRVPESMVSDVKAYVETKGFALPLYATRVQAGFPSPADDYMEDKLDLNSHLIQHPSATYFVRVTGDSMINAGIHDGDLLIVDRSLDAVDGKIVIAAIDGELTVKRLGSKNKTRYLFAENPRYHPIELKKENDVVIWGVVTRVIHDV